MWFFEKFRGADALLSTGVEDGRFLSFNKNKTIYLFTKVKRSLLLQLMALFLQLLALLQQRLSHPLQMDVPDICFVGQKLGNPEP
jgi:hypothetical protein